MSIRREWGQFLDKGSLLGDGLDLVAGLVKSLSRAFGIGAKNSDDKFYQTPPIDMLEQDLTLNITTRSSARRAAKLMLARLSPLPAAQIEWDIVGPHHAGDGQDEEKNSQYSLGIVRKTDLENWDSLQEEHRSLTTAARHGGTYRFTSSFTQQTKRKQTLFGLLIFVACYLALLWGVTQWANRPVQIADELREQARDIRLDTRDVRAELERVQARTALIKQYQANAGGTQILDILASLVKTMPDEAWLREVNLSGGQVRISGYTDNPAKLAAHMEAKPVIARVQLGAVSADRASGLQRFTLTMVLAEAVQ